MNTLVAVAIAPFGTGDELAKEPLDVFINNAGFRPSKQDLFHVHRN